MPVPKNAVAVGKEQAGLELLGRLTTYTMPDDPVRGTKLVKAFAAAGLEDFVDFLPEQRTATHVFQSACRSVEVKQRDSSNARIQVAVDEVLNDADRCVYQITRIERDKDNAVIEHHAGFTLSLDKTSEAITVAELKSYADVAPLEAQVRDHFAANGKNVPGQKVRNAIREIILSIGGQNLRRKAGGLYFVPPQYTNGKVKDSLPVLDGLKHALTSLYGERADFYVIPLASDEDAQAMVAKHFTINVTDNSRAMLEKIVNRIRQGKGRGVRPDLLSGLYNERRKIGFAVAQFEQMVTLEKSDIEANLSDLDAKLAELQELADSE